MAGGAGMRIMAGEKPLLLVNDRPMIAWVAGAFQAAGCEPVVVTTSRTPMTSNWCRAQGIPLQPASGRGYIEDMVEAAVALGVERPLFVSVSDLPCLRPEILCMIRKMYDESGKDACSVWVPASMSHAAPESMPYRETIDGIASYPAGVNILRGDRITLPQDEKRILVRDKGLAFNVNTREDRRFAEEFLKIHPLD